jgi:hypothetical protein
VIVAALLLLAVSVAVACGGDDDEPEGGDVDVETTDTTDASPEGTDDEIEVVMSTFTPTPPDNTPESVRERERQQTAFAETQTAQPQTTATQPPDVTINPNTPVATIPSNAVRPPELVMGTSAGQQSGTIGSMNWYDPVRNAGYNGDTPYVQMPTGNLDWASDTEASFTVPESPYAVRSTQINVFVYDDNVAIPQNSQGQVIGDYVFARQTDPVDQEQIEGATISINPDLEPGNYIIEAVVTWDGPPELEAQYNEALFTQYVFVVTVI